MKRKLIGFISILAMFLLYLINPIDRLDTDRQGYMVENQNSTSVDDHYKARNKSTNESQSKKSKSSKDASKSSKGSSNKKQNNKKTTKKKQNESKKTTKIAINKVDKKEKELKSQFRTKDLLKEHYEKHVVKQKEFGDITIDEYLSLAQQLVDNPSDSVLTKKEEDGDLLYYDSDTNSFAVKSTDGFIRTFFKPSDGIEYYNRQ